MAPSPQNWGLFSEGGVPSPRNHTKGKPSPENSTAENFQQVFERSPRRAAQACFPRYPASSVGIEAHAIIINFDFNKNNLRVIEMDGQPWFLLKDVAELLGLKAHPNGGFHHHLVKLDVSEVSHSSELGVKPPVLECTRPSGSPSPVSTSC